MKKPFGKGFPKNPVTIGEHIRKRRMELRMKQKEIAKSFGVTTDTITNWESGRAEPKVPYLPKIIDFLGFFPKGNCFDSLGNRIKEFRKIHGCTQRQMGKLLCVHATTIGSWEMEKFRPNKTIKAKLMELIGY